MAPKPAARFHIGGGFALGGLGVHYKITSGAWYLEVM